MDYDAYIKKSKTGKNNGAKIMEFKEFLDGVKALIKKAEDTSEDEPKKEEEIAKISIDDFAKVSLKVGEIVESKKHPNAEKLLVSQIKIGNETRQIVSGIAKYYDPQSLVGKKVIVVTAHRRENLGQPLKNICNAVKRLANEYADLEFIYPVHLNPAVRDTANEILGDVSNVHLIPPIDVEDMHNVMDRSFLVMTDSGGLQEEAPSCGVPVLVLRTETERPEAVEAGTVKVVGVEEEDIVREAKLLIENVDEYNKMARAINPYGDGHASERIVKHILEWKEND